MIWNGLSYKGLLAFALVLASALPTINSNGMRALEKRQIGVLARTGALPQGKRSVEVLARNGELPVASASRKESSEEPAIDSILDEIENEENLGQLRALVERLVEERFATDFEKRSVAALARNGELPQKKNSEIVSRSGYLVRPAQETVQAPVDLLDPDDFLGTARKLWQDSDPNDYRHYDKKNVGASKNFGKRRFLENYSNRQDYYAPEGRFWNVDKPCDKGNGKKRKGNGFFERWEDTPGVPYFQKANGADREDGPTSACEERTTVAKRFLGRIPQLGRIHQKVQSPSSRRRPHLRPNWL